MFLPICPNCKTRTVGIFDYDSFTNEPYYICTVCNCRCDKKSNVIERNEDEKAMTVLFESA